MQAEEFLVKIEKETAGICTDVFKGVRRPTGKDL